MSSCNTDLAHVTFFEEAFGEYRQDSVANVCISEPHVDASVRIGWFDGFHLENSLEKWNEQHLRPVHALDCNLETTCFLFRHLAMDYLPEVVSTNDLHPDFDVQRKFFEFSTASCSKSPTFFAGDPPNGLGAKRMNPKSENMQFCGLRSVVENATWRIAGGLSRLDFLQRESCQHKTQKARRPHTPVPHLAGKHARIAAAYALLHAHDHTVHSHRCVYNRVVTRYDRVVHSHRCVSLAQFSFPVRSYYLTDNS